MRGDQATHLDDRTRPELSLYVLRDPFPRHADCIQDLARDLGQRYNSRLSVWVVGWMCGRMGVFQELAQDLSQ